MRLTIHPWEHQMRMAGLVVRSRQGLLLAGCGTGKTLGSVEAINHVGARRVLVLTVRAACQSVWEEDLTNHTDIDPMDMRILDNRYGSISDRRKALEQHKHQRDFVVVTNYEAAALLSLGDFEWDYVIADESHRLKSHNSRQSMELADQLRNVPYKLAMTGTSWDDRPTDVFGQERFLHPSTRGPNWMKSDRFGSWTQFFEKVVNYRTMDNIKIPESYKNLDWIAGLLEPHFLHIDRDKVLDLPPVQHIVRDVWLSPEHMDAYDELKEQMITELFPGGVITADNQLVLQLRLHQIAGGYYQPDDEGEVCYIPNGHAKLEALGGLLEEIGKEPVVIFCRFTEDVRRIADLLERMDLSYKLLIGGKDQHQEWKRGEAQVLICNIQAGGVGINLTRAAVAIMYTTGHSNTDYTQALYRIDRPPQTRKVTIYHLNAAGTVDTDIRETLQAKTGTRNALLEQLEKQSKPKQRLFAPRRG